MLSAELHNTWPRLSEKRGVETEAAGAQAELARHEEVAFCSCFLFFSVSLGVTVCVWQAAG